MRSAKKRCPSSGLGSDGSTAFGSMPRGAVGQVGLVWDTHFAQSSGYSPTGPGGTLSGGEIIVGSTSRPVG